MLSILIGVIHFGGCAWVIMYYMKVDGILIKGSTLVAAGFHVYVFAETVYILWSGFYLKLKQKTILSQMTNLYELEENLKKCEINLDYFKIRRKIITMEIVFVAIKHFLLIIGHFVQPNLNGFEEILLNVVSVFIYLSPTSVNLTYNVFFLIIGSMLQKVNDKFCEINDNNDIPNKIHKLANIHQQLTEYILKTSKIFGFYSLISLLRHFTLIILQVFSFLLMFIHQDVVYPVLALFFVMVIDAVLTIFVTIAVGNKCIKEWQRTKSILINFVLNYKDKATRKEITALSLQLFHEYPVISPLGFFVVDTKLAFAMMSAISMYTIILIQFDTKIDIVKAFLNTSKINEF
ncbi:putative gustatory receptor 28a [Onthophagus taurus]|uniref:putative gustatory receptor 28a n=1 Tax=Onthophagus taurus TaxID=166361 RepID=UPI0039BDD5FC